MLAFGNLLFSGPSRRPVLTACLRAQRAFTAQDLSAGAGIMTQQVPELVNNICSVHGSNLTPVFR
jgi:hypothetical protein